MILLIDGYNFIKSLINNKLISEEIRLRFVKKLNYYSKIKNHKVVIVFDGGESSYSTKETIENVDVVYSGYKISADEFIKSYLVENKNQNLFLITSDRDLQKFALSLNIEFISSRRFYDLLNSSEEIKLLSYKK